VEKANVSRRLSSSQHLPVFDAGSVTKRLLCTPVESIYEYKTRGEEQWHCGPHGAIARGAETGVICCGGAGDRQKRWRSGVSSCAHPFFLPPPRGEADAQNVPPIPAPDALLCAFGAVP
jgi:hypothetical protein